MKKHTVTVGIPAHNEEANIQNILRSILKQNNSNFVIEKIYVFCDGCTDNTALKAKEVAKTDKRIVVINDGKRKGKTARLNSLYRRNKSEYIFNFDGDIMLGDSHVMENMVRKISSNKNIALASAINLPIKGGNFIQRITSAGDLMWSEVRLNYKNGQNIYNSSGCSSIVRKSFADKLKYSKNVVADQQYIYHKTILAGYKFALVKNAFVYYISPGTIKGYLMQASRSLYEKQPIIEELGTKIEKEYFIPRQLKLKSVLISIKKRPVFTMLSILFNLLLRAIPLKKDELHAKGMWQSIVSTKSSLHLFL